MDTPEIKKTETVHYWNANMDKVELVAPILGRTAMTSGGPGLKSRPLANGWKFALLNHFLCRRWMSA